MLRKIYNKDSIMEYFFLILFALMIFFWMVKKESQKIEQMNLQQWRHLYERTGQLETFFHTYKEVNQFYQTAQKELDKVNKEIKNMNKLNSQLSKELYRLKDMFDVIPIPDSNGQKFVWDIKKLNDHLKVVDLKKKGKKDDKGSGNKNNH